MAKIDFKVTVNDGTFQRLIENSKKINKAYVKVGVLAAKSGREASKDTEDNENLTNVEIGLLHEFGDVEGEIEKFGSYEEAVPIRSFIKMPLEHKKDFLLKSMNKKMIKAALVMGNVKKALEILGVEAENVIQEAFESGGFGKWAPLAPSTIEKKGSAAILIETGQLRRSISSQVVGL